MRVNQKRRPVAQTEYENSLGEFFHNDYKAANGKNAEH